MESTSRSLQGGREPPFDISSFVSLLETDARKSTAFTMFHFRVRTRNLGYLWEYSIVRLVRCHVVSTLYRSILGFSTSIGISTIHQAAGRCFFSHPLTGGSGGTSGCT